MHHHLRQASGTARIGMINHDERGGGRQHQHRSYCSWKIGLLNYHSIVRSVTRLAPTQRRPLPLEDRPAAADPAFGLLPAAA
jgi:hypothetical protein